MEQVEQKGNENDQKEFLGTILFSQIQLINEANAPKITGMILELSNKKCVDMINDQELLQNKVHEALELL